MTHMKFTSARTAIQRNECDALERGACGCELHVGHLLFLSVQAWLISPG